jgi:hypothetical protein
VIQNNCQTRNTACRQVEWGLELSEAQRLQQTSDNNAGLNPDDASNSNGGALLELFTD